MRSSNPRLSIGRRRALVLILVHVAIVAHVVHWRLSGETLKPLVLSESMDALEHGRINAGTVLFALMIVATLLWGRFFCGWACHMGGLQDLCAWVLRKCGAKPRQFRARLLGYVPLGLALYMFAWPSFNRIVLVPLLRERWPEALAAIGPAPPITGISADFVTDDLWQGLPGWAVAIPFLLVCGFATVWFLGARGLCHYGCPYGGVFAPAGRLAPGRVVVDRDACDGCGRCTAACSSGIRVHEEVDAYGSVVSDRCVKTLECVWACPTAALRLGLTTPAILERRPKRAPPRVRYDLSWPEEILVLGCFLLVLFTVRGLYGAFPFLMSVGMAICASFLAWKLWRVLRNRDVRLAGLALRIDGRLLPAGTAFCGLGLLLGTLLLHSLAVRGVHFLGGQADDEVRVSRDEILRGFAVPPATAQAARRALRLYTLGASWRHGGFALADTPAIDVRAAWVALVSSEHARAEALLARTMTGGEADDDLTADLARVILVQGERERALAHLESAVAERPGMVHSLDLLCSLLGAEGRSARIEELLRRELERAQAGPSAAALRARLSHFLSLTGRSTEALAQLERATQEAPQELWIRAELASALARDGRVDDALAELEQAGASIPGAAASCRAWSQEIRAAFPERPSGR